MDALPTAQFASLVYGAERVPADDPAEAFHEASRLYPNLAPERLPVLLELAGNVDLEQTIARSSRTHEHRPGVELPPATSLREPLDHLLARRRSCRPDTLRPVRLAQLATLLAAGYASRVHPDGVARRPVPSGGGLYPLELYVVALAVDGLACGVHHYDPFRHRLALLGPGSWTGVRAALVDPGLADSAAAAVVVTAMFWRARFKYGARGYRFALIEAGHLAQNLLLAATSLDLPALPVGGFYDRRLDELVGADGLDQASVYALVLGGST